MSARPEDATGRPEEPAPGTAGAPLPGQGGRVGVRPRAAPAAGRPAAELLRDIANGALDPRLLPRDARSACVAYLVAEGRVVGEIAAILKISDRTVFREKDRIRAEQALVRSPTLEAELLGDAARRFDAAADIALRVGREPKSSAKERLAASRTLAAVVERKIRTLQSAGYVPRLVPGDAPGECDPAAGAQAEDIAALLAALEASGLSGAPEARAARALLPPPPAPPPGTPSPPPPSTPNPAAAAPHPEPAP